MTDLHNFMPAVVIWDRRFVRLEIGSFIESLAQLILPILEVLLIAGYCILSHCLGFFIDFSKEFDTNICVR